ncbi:recombinase family protein [Neobacillus cucumis]|uniref:recombinase family protein n=1 Tax=Neobacillus cucumis TaxID=1740721 RepID=UPI002042427C|nr:recombinase family protein [Neobacillus cucumis]MCM3724578.1 recombinase family protein [Neobacillus cucumis]
MKVAIYLRRSRDEENLGIDEVLKVHEHTLVHLCKQQGHTYNIYREIASSSTIENRPEMVRLLERIKAGEYQAVVVMDIDRLSRNEYDSSEIKRILHDTGTLIITPYRVYDLSRDDDSLLVGINSLIASQEYKMIHKRMSRAKNFCKQQGQWVDGIPPLGFDKGKDKKLKPNDRAADVLFIFESIINGMTIPSLIRELDRLHILTREGSKWHYNAILRIINNPVYKGELHGVVEAHDQIVLPSIWEKANRIVNTYSFKAPRSKNRIYPTSGLVYCGNCGKVQGVNYHPHIDKYYVKVCRCGNRTYYYNIVLELIRQEVLKHKETILEAIALLDTETGTDKTRYKLESIRKAIQKTERALEKIQIQWEEDEMTLPEYKQRKAKRTEELEILKAEQESIANENPAEKRRSLEEHLKVIEELFGNWAFLNGSGLSNEDVNRRLHLLISGIIWTYPKGSDTPTLRVVYN